VLNHINVQEEMGKPIVMEEFGFLEMQKLYDPEIHPQLFEIIL